MLLYCFTVSPAAFRGLPSLWHPNEQSALHPPTTLMRRHGEKPQEEAMSAATPAHAGSFGLFGFTSGVQKGGHWQAGAAAAWLQAVATLPLCCQSRVSMLFVIIEFMLTPFVR
jgi:hypothetical protein